MELSVGDRVLSNVNKVAVGLVYTVVKVNKTTVWVEVNGHTYKGVRPHILKKVHV